MQYLSDKEIKLATDTCGRQ